MRRICQLAVVLVLTLFLAGWLAPARPALAGGGAAEGDRVSGKRRMTLEQTVGSEVFQKAGLAKLSQEEQFVLADWIRAYGIQISKYTEEQCGKQPAPIPAPKQP